MPIRRIGTEEVVGGQGVEVGDHDVGGKVGPGRRRPIEGHFDGVEKGERILHGGSELRLGGRVAELSLGPFDVEGGEDEERALRRGPVYRLGLVG